jgi:hypothetical protein
MQRVLSFEQAPPISIPLRYFLSAPLFAFAAGLLLAWSGPDALVSRWSPITLSLTHLLTLGFLAMAMMGALLQMLPVVAGADVPAVRMTAGVVHLFLLLGTIVLCAAFWRTTPVFFKTAVVLLSVAFVWLLAATLYAVMTAHNKNDTLASMRLALASLMVTVVLGVALASAFAWSLGVPFPLLVRLHAAWGLVGWISLLIIGVALQVVPMFQVTPVYPMLISRWLTWGLFALLTLWSVANIAKPDTAAWYGPLLSVCIAGGLALFSLTTLYLLWKRKRPVSDPTTSFWRIGLASLLLSALVWIAGELVPDIATQPLYPLLLGVLFIAGFAYSIVNGMLYKIVPFLVWYHLQSRIEKGQGKAPNVKKIVTDQAANRQCVAHAVALVIMLAAVFWPQLFARLAGGAFAVSALWLWINLFAATLTYRRIALLHKAGRAPAVN